jgi:hypothetical protein
VTWKGLPKDAKFYGNKRLVKVRYTKPGKYHITAVSKGHSEKLDAYAVRVKIEGALERKDPAGVMTLPKSVPLNGTGGEQVEITPDLSGSPYQVDLDVHDGGDPDAGAASVAPGELKKSGMVQIRGVRQTDPNNKLQLRLRAKIGNRVAALSAPDDWFSVCAHPLSIAYTYDREFPGIFVPKYGAPVWGQGYALNVPGVTISSDSGKPEDLDQVQLAEDVKVGPGTGFFPLTHPSDTSTSYGPCLGKYLDYHAFPGSAADLHRLFNQALGNQASGDAGYEVTYQVIRFACARCGIEADKGKAAVIPRSAFHIDYQAYKASGHYYLRVAKHGGVHPAYPNVLPGLVDNIDFHTVEIK